MPVPLELTNRTGEPARRTASRSGSTARGVRWVRHGHEVYEARHRADDTPAATRRRWPVACTRAGLGHRLRVPRRGPRGVHGRGSGTTWSGSRSTSRKVEALAAGRAPFYEPGLPELLARSSPRAGCGSPPTSRVARRTGRIARRADVHFVCVGTPQRRASSPPTSLRRRRGRSAAAAPAARAPGRRQVDRAGGHGRPAGRARSHGRGARRRCWRGTRSSCARASRSRTPCTRTGSSYGLRRHSEPAAPRRCCARSTRPARRRHPGRRHRLRHRRAGQGRRERVPRHEDLLHQRDGRGVRGGRRGRHAAGRRDRLRRPHRRRSSSTPASGSAAAACPRTSGRSWPGPASSAPTRR